MTRLRIALICLVILFCFFPGGCASGKMSAELSSLYRKAEFPFRKGNELRNTNAKAAKVYFFKALAYFQAVRDRGGMENGRLLFNIANCYFRMGNMGMAVLNYRRAERLRPRDLRIEENLALTRSICDRDSGATDQTPNPSLPVARFYKNGRMVTWLFPVFSALFWGCFGLYLTNGRKWVRNVLAVLGLTVVISGCLLSIDMMRVYWEPGGVVVNKTVARQGNSAAFGAAPPGVLTPGTEFQLVERKDGWFLIRTAGGKRGWVPRESAKLINQ